MPKPTPDRTVEITLSGARVVDIPLRVVNPRDMILPDDENPPFIVEVAQPTIRGGAVGVSPGDTLVALVVLETPRVHAFTCFGGSARSVTDPWPADVAATGISVTG